jgi:hypothetical protein
MSVASQEERRRFSRKHFANHVVVLLVYLSSGFGYLFRGLRA